MAITATAPAIDAVCDALLRYSNAFAGLLRRVPDPAVTAVGVWSIAETAVHVSQSSQYFLGAAKGVGELENLEQNSVTTIAAVDSEPARNLDVLADRIVAGEADLVAYARRVEGDPEVHPFQGSTVPLSGLLAIELSELLVHGWDIARAAGRPWAIAPVDAAVAVSGCLQVMPLMLDVERAARMTVRCQIDIRHGLSIVLALEDGALHVESSSKTAVDCHVWVDPVTFLLLSFNRVSKAHALLTGKVIPWGPKPWAFTRLGGVLKSV